MESLENSNGLGQSMNDSFSLYERYMRSFNIVDSRVDKKDNLEPREPHEPVSPSHSYCDSSNSRGNIDLSTAQSSILDKHCNNIEIEGNILNQNTSDNNADKLSDSEYRAETDYQSNSPAAESLLDNSSTTAEHSHLTEKSNQTGFLFASSEESKRETFKPPLFLTSTMENSNNAVDSVPMFHDVRHSESVFKLPNIELTFNGTIKHVQKLTPIVDPVTALSSQNLVLGGKSEDQSEHNENSLNIESNDTSYDQKTSDASDDKSIDVEALEKSESTGDSKYEESNLKKEFPVNDDESSTKWNLENSHSSFEASFDSGVRSPNMFSDDDDYDNDAELAEEPEPEPFWNFLTDYEAFDKRKVKKLEENLQGILPPPSVTTIKTDVTEMLKKYYNFLPLFNENAKLNVSEEANSTTPTKRVSFIEIPELQQTSRNAEDESLKIGLIDKSHSNSDGSVSKLNNSDLDTSVTDKTIDLKMCTQIEAVETSWPELLKCRHYDVYYNVTKYSEKFELLALKYGERYVGAETDTSVNIYSGGFQSPSSAYKRKALRLKLAQAKSPGRRLSHLARRRQAFCSAATINEKAQASNSKMVLIDKKKLVNSSERKSPRVRRTPGKTTPKRQTTGKRTPAKTPKTRSGGSSKKKAMRRLLMDPESLTRSQPSRETLKRALFISPDNRKPVPPGPSTSVPLNAMKTKRALFDSPTADTKSLDGAQSDQFLKRKRDSLDDIPESRSKIAKSLSFGGGTIGASQSVCLSRRASEVFGKRTAELNDNHKQKLLWAVSEALRVHGWRMSSPGFREKASNLARLTRRLLTLPPNAARLAALNSSTSDIMLKLARKYVFAIIQGRTVEDCFEEEQTKLANETNNKVTGYISANAYQQIKARENAATSFNPKIKENSCGISDSSTIKQEPKSGTKNVLQDKLVNIDSNSNSSSCMSMIDKASLGIFKSNSMPSFDEAAKIRARRQISFDNVDFPKRSSMNSQDNDLSTVE